MSGEVRRKKWIAFVIGLAVLLATLGSRITIARLLANDEPDDGRTYALLANNLLEHHVYSLETAAPFNPTLIRLPGYPLFLAAIYAVFGHGNNTAVRIVQALIDTATCVLAAVLAWSWLEDERQRRIAAGVAFALVALCPFTAIYVATILTETLTTFLMLLMTLAATYAFKVKKPKASLGLWFLAGGLAGAAVLVRPDSGLFAAALGLTLVIAGLSMHLEKDGNETARKFRHRLSRTILRGFVFSLAFALMLAPWTIRNERVFHLFQPLAPAHAEMPGEFVPHGYNRWLRTWIDDGRYIGPMLWNLDDKPIKIEQVPPSAFDSEDERARVAALLDRYNHPPDEEDNSDQSGQADSSKSGGDEESADDNSQDEGDQGDETGESAEGEADDSQDEAQGDEADQSVEMTPEIDAGFAELARERIARAPLRYYVKLPVQRAVSLWFDTHSAYYPFAGELFPLKDLDRDEHQQLWLPLFAALVWLYTLLGVAGAIVLLLKPQGASRLWLLLVLLMTLPRIAFFSTLENPEPRYVVELFAFVSILGAIALARIKLKRSEAKVPAMG